MQEVEQVQQARKTGLVLLNMGGPKTLEDVRPFLYNLFADPDIINLPWLLKPFQKPLAWLIAKFRTPGTTEMYQQIGDGSPILAITEDLGQQLAENLNHASTPVIASVAMRYTYPRAKDAIETLQQEGVDQVILFSQYPHYADSTTGSSLREFKDEMAVLGFEPKSTVIIDEWGTEPEYINWWVDGIETVFKTNNIKRDKNTHLIFSAHGLPKRYVDAGERYPDRIKEAANLIMDQLGQLTDEITCHVSFQSQAGPVEWTKPYTDELLEEIAKIPGQNVVIVPIGFVSNHVETLYEIDILYKDQALADGIAEYYRVEVPDAHPEYAKSIAQMIQRKVEES